jgi:hypothetical protein
MRNRKRDLFRDLPGFLATIEEIIARGFFESFNVDLTSMPGFMSMRITATGKIPDDPEKDLQDGVQPFVSIHRVMRSLEDQVKKPEFRLTINECKIDTKEWLKLGRDGETVMGSLGSETRLTLSVSGIEKPQRKKKN